jgi:hypothetical protein
MNFFTSLFSLAASKDTDIQGEINIPDAITAHVNWKVRLQKYIDGKSDEKLDPMVVCRDDQCTLGQWIHGPATKIFHADKAFHTLRSDHAQFHYVAANVVRYMQEGDKAGAEALLKGEYARVSHHVVMMLNELNQQEGKS